MLTWQFAENTGVWQCRVPRSDRSGADLLSVLLPEPYLPGAQYPVVYLLPVEAQQEHVYGDPLAVLRQLDAPRRYRCIFALPTFATIPWYGHHATNPAIRHDADLLQTIIPLVEQRFSTPGTPAGRRLLGFSKSGWGAFSLIARYPEIIGAAVLLFGILAIAANAQTLSKPGDVDLSFVFSRGLQPLLVGVLVLGIGVSLGGTTGYAINPARDLGPRIAHALLPIPGKRDSDWSYAWVPVVAPIVGGLLAACIAKAIL
jgi:hypothetical protein